MINDEREGDRVAASYARVKQKRWLCGVRLSGCAHGLPCIPGLSRLQQAEDRAVVLSLTTVNERPSKREAGSSVRGKTNPLETLSHNLAAPGPAIRGF